MNKVKLILFAIASGLIFTSCEDVIILELEDETPKVVIEGNFNASSGSVEVIVSKSNGFYEDGQQIRTDNAIVSLTREDGPTYILDSDSEKLYALENLEVESGQQYTLTITLDDQTYSASTIVPDNVELLKIDTSIFTPPFGGSGEVFYQMFSEWQDTPGVEDFYRLKTYSNGIYESGNYILYNDVNADGNLFRRPIMQFFNAGNLYKIELLSMDKESFEYFQQLSTIQSQGGGSSVPFNPKGNFSKDAIGYFGIYYSSSIEVQL